MWVAGWLDYNPGNRDNTDIRTLLDPKRAKFAPYLPSAAVYKCPADTSYVTIKGKRQLRIRSMGMSQAMGAGVWLPGSQYKVYIKTGDLLNLVRPTSTFCWMNTRTASTQVVCKPNGAQSQFSPIIDYPASYHNSAAGLSFADGHAEIKKWLDHRTIKPINNRLMPLNIASPNNKDMIWLSDRTTIRK